MKRVFKGAGLTLFFILLTNFLMAQTIVSGTVMDGGDLQEPLIGASVLVEGTSTGTVTDFEGKYSLKLPEGATNLVFSYTGYENQVVPIDGRTTIDVTLSQGAVLDEVVVVGYGTLKKSDVTGAITKVGEEDFNKGAIASPEQLLDGRTSGVQVTAGSGAPGAGTQINIRGASSIRAGNSPLIVIDGVQLDSRSPEPGGDVSGLGRSQGSNPLAFIDPNTIESMEILKDASATAIYGSRGANGVIIITTKKGRSGAPSVEYNVSQGISSILKKPDYLDAAGYRSALTALGADQANDFGASIDPLDEILQTGYTNSHALNISGGTEKYTFRVSGSLFDQTGIVQNSGLTKYVGGLNSSFKMFDNDRVTIDLNLTASNVAREAAPISDDAGFEGSLIGAALQWNPTRAMVKPDGTYDQDIVENRNPLALSDYSRDNSTTMRVLGSIGATVNIIEGLDYKFATAFDKANGERRLSVDTRLNLNDILGVGQAILGNNELTSSQFTHTLNYQKQVNPNFRLNLLAGYEYLKYTNSGVNAVSRGFSAVDEGIDYTNVLQAGPFADQRTIAFRDPDVELQSFFGRGVFSFMEKAVLTATIRRDGSSKFGSNNRYGTFPSLAVSYNLGKEDFTPDVFDNLNLRLGWGITGNQEFPAGSSQDYFVFEDGALSNVALANEDLSWESTEQYNAGLDFAFMDYKITGSIDYFRKTTEDLLLVSGLPQPSIDEDVQNWKNTDVEIKNQGVELALNVNVLNKGDMAWDIGVNSTFLSNEMSGVGSRILRTGAINGQGLTGAFAQQLTDGESLFSYYLPVFVGFDAEGISIYDDGNGGTTRIATVDRVKQFVGDPLPDFLLGISTNFRYGNFDVALNFNGMYGYSVYNNTTNAVFVKGNLTNGRNSLADQVENGESVNNSYPASTRYLESGNHIRLSNMTLGYSFSELPGWLKGARFTLTGQNLFLITDYSGFDPVVNTNKEINGVPSAGIEYTPYPTARTFLLGLNVKF